MNANSEPYIERTRCAFANRVVSPQDFRRYVYDFIFPSHACCEKMEERNEEEQCITNIKRATRANLLNQGKNIAELSTFGCGGHDTNCVKTRTN